MTIEFSSSGHSGIGRIWIKLCNLGISSQSISPIKISVPADLSGELEHCGRPEEEVCDGDVLLVGVVPLRLGRVEQGGAADVAAMAVVQSTCGVKESFPC